jgi:hypothetical protein
MHEFLVPIRLDGNKRPRSWVIELLWCVKKVPKNSGFLTIHSGRAKRSFRKNRIGCTGVPSVSKRAAGHIEAR